MAEFSWASFRQNAPHLPRAVLVLVFYVLVTLLLVCMPLLAGREYIGCTIGAVFGVLLPVLFRQTIGENPVRSIGWLNKQAFAVSITTLLPSYVSLPPSAYAIPSFLAVSWIGIWWFVHCSDK